MQDTNSIFAKRLDNDSDDKIALVEEILKRKCKNVLDLGAGTATLSKQIAKHKIHVDAVDKDFKLTGEDALKADEFINYYPLDILNFITHIDKKYDCIILSALLHELSPDDLKFLNLYLPDIMDSNGCLILIREPYFQLSEDKKYFKPFKSLEAQKAACNDIYCLTPTAKTHDYLETTKLSEQGYLFSKIPYPIWLLNLTFANSYGEISWEREKHEYRYAFDINFLTKWIKNMFDKESLIIFYHTYRKDYSKFFREVGYLDNIFEAIDYTNCLIIAEGKPKVSKFKRFWYSMINGGK